MTETFHIKAEVSCFKLKGEDFHFIKNLTASATVCGETVGVTYVILGVFDGHGGKRCADYVAKQFPTILAQQSELRLQKAVDSFDYAAYAALSKSGHPSVQQVLLQDALVKCAPEMLVASFLLVDQQFLCKQADSGTTATVSLICGMDVVTANVGDSLAFLDRGNAVHQLSGNHRIDDNAFERKRLKDAGGEISQSEVDGHACGPLRIWPGGLAMSRTIGDRHAGSRVTAEPSVSQIRVGAAGARITIASDGLWDAFNNNGRSVCHRIRELQHTRAAARLRSAAKEKREKDDITVICCDLLPDESFRIPPALIHRKEQDVHQVWHPLLHPHTWHGHWSARMEDRMAPYSPCLKEEEPGPSECITGESSASSREGSQSLDAPAMHPASLYEQVKALHITCAADEDDHEWVTVPMRRAQGAGEAAKLPSSTNKHKPPVNSRRKRRPPGRGRGQRVSRVQEHAVPPSQPDAGKGRPERSVAPQDMCTSGAREDIKTSSSTTSGRLVRDMPASCSTRGGRGSRAPYSQRSGTRRRNHTSHPPHNSVAE